MKCKILFRADGSNTQGLGHVIRSLALTEMLSPVHECEFIVKECPEELIPYINEKVSYVHQIPKSIASKDEPKFLLKSIVTIKDILILDGYQFDYNYQNGIIHGVRKLVSIDDIFATKFSSHVIINHAGGIKKENYKTTGNSEFYLGPKYALLRKEFIKAAKIDYTKSKSDSRLFICLGGADPKNDTCRIVKKIFDNHFFDQINIVVGAGYQHLSVLKEVVEDLPVHISIYRNINAEELLSIMSNCFHAICSASTISYEFLSTRGILYLVQIADNQKDLYNYLIQNKLAFTLNQLPLSDSKKAHESLQRQSQVFDGDQPKRFVRLFDNLFLNLRPTKKSDLTAYFEWANDPLVRTQSFLSDAINIADHTKWFQLKLIDPNAILFILEYKDEPAGQIRFDRKAKAYIISYSIAKKFRGKGFGKNIIKLGIKALNQKDIPIVGYVKFSNLASIKIFRELNFIEEIAKENDQSYKYTLLNHEF